MKELNQWLDAREKEIKTGRKKHKKSMFHRLAYDDLAACLQDMRNAIDDGNLEGAVLLTIRFMQKYKSYSLELSIPDIYKAVSSDIARKKVNKRHALPMPTVKALKTECKQVQQELEEKTGKEVRPTTVYKAVSMKLWDNKKYWRRIRTQVTKPQ